MEKIRNLKDSTKRDKIYTDFIKRELCILEAKKLHLDADPNVAVKMRSHSNQLLVNESYEQLVAFPLIDQDDIDGVVEVLKSGHLSLGPKIVEFEESFKAYTGNTHAIACSSGTAALHMILLGMGIGKGDEVIVPSFTFVSCSLARSICSYSRIIGSGVPAQPDF